MTTTTLTPAERKALKARAHSLDPVVLIGDAGLTPAVLKEIGVHLTAHELIKVRVAGDDREERVAIYDAICTQLHAAPVQHIGKMLVLFRGRPAVAKSPALSSRTAKSGAKAKPGEPATRRATVRSGSAKARKPAVKSKPDAGPYSTRKAASGTRPPRTARVRASGQRSAKKAHQGH